MKKQHRNKYLSSDKEYIAEAFSKQELKKLGYFFEKENLYKHLLSLYGNPFQYAVENNLKNSYLYLLKNFYEKKESKSFDFLNKEDYKKAYLIRKDSYEKFLEFYLNDRAKMLSIKKSIKR